MLARTGTQHQTQPESRIKRKTLLSALLNSGVVESSGVRVRQTQVWILALPPNNFVTLDESANPSVLICLGCYKIPQTG